MQHKCPNHDHFCSMLRRNLRWSLQVTWASRHRRWSRTCRRLDIPEIHGQKMGRSIESLRIHLWEHFSGNIYGNLIIIMEDLQFFGLFSLIRRKVQKNEQEDSIKKVILNMIKLYEHIV